MAAFVLLASLGACTPRPVKRPAATKPALTEQHRVERDRAFYEAVDAYLDGDYVQSKERLGAVLKLEPGNRAALDLRERLRAAEKASIAR